MRLYYYLNSFYSNKYEGIDGKKILNDGNYPLIVKFLNNMNKNKKINEFVFNYDLKISMMKKEL